MKKLNNVWMLIAACCTFLAAILHVLIIIGGADWYRFFGAGTQMAVLAEQGHWYPTLVTSVITLILVIWGLYALSASGVLAPLPLYKWVLVVIASIFLLRGLCFVSAFHFVPGLSESFWMFSSLISLGVGVIYSIGLTKLFVDGGVIT